MAIDKKFINIFQNVCTKAALASHYFVGKKDKIAADKAAVDAMRSELNKIEMNGQVVIGEGELDEAPMLYIGEKLDNFKKTIEENNSLYETMLDKTSQSLEKIISNTETLSKIQ